MKKEWWSICKAEEKLEQYTKSKIMRKYDRIEDGYSI